MNLTKKQKLVYKVIQDTPWVVNDDADLIAAVWRQEGWDDGRSLEDNIKYVSRAETITRRKRELYNLGLIKYSEQREKEIVEAMRNERDYHSTWDMVFGNKGGDKEKMA